MRADLCAGWTDTRVTEKILRPYACRSWYKGVATCVLAAEVGGLAQPASELRGRERAVGQSDSSVHRDRMQLGLARESGSL